MSGVDAKAKIARAIQLGEFILKRRCVGFDGTQLRQAMRVLSEIKHTPDCTPEQRQRIDRINLHILTQLHIRGDTFVWSPEE